MVAENPFGKETVLAGTPVLSQTPRLVKHEEVPLVVSISTRVAEAFVNF